MGIIRKAISGGKRIAETIKGTNQPKQPKPEPWESYPQEGREAYQKGVKAAYQKKAYSEGYSSVMQPKNQGGGWAGTARAVESSLNNTERLFGFQNFGVGGLDFGLGGSSAPAKKQPQRVTKITRGGTVIITEPTQAAIKKKAQSNSTNFFEEIDKNNPF